MKITAIATLTSKVPSPVASNELAHAPDVVVSVLAAMEKNSCNKNTQIMNSQNATEFLRNLLNR
jgi:hypothetical protein